jgi:hypothetical protein
MAASVWRVNPFDRSTFDGHALFCQGRVAFGDFAGDAAGPFGVRWVEEAASPQIVENSYAFLKRPPVRKPQNLDQKISLV